MSNVAKVFTVAPIGYDGHIIEVESDITKGLPSLQIVGLGSKSIDEARERVKSALLNSLLEYPAKRITINLAPAELPKDGTHYDLPIALAVMASSGQLRARELAKAVYAGELSLDGQLRPTKGAVVIAETAKKAGYTTVYLPTANAKQALLVEGIAVIGVDSLKDLYLHLKQEKALPSLAPQNHPSSPTLLDTATYIDDIYGQEQAKRALAIAAAGHHNLLLNGSPGAGKTMLAKVVTTLLPPLSMQEVVDVTKIHSLAGESVQDVIYTRPYRSPHHTTSTVALIGGGARPKPGEVSLAHHGVLFLDEIPEFPRAVLESLRQPMEDNHVSVSRANGRVTYPADFMLIATMNPCPCGYYGDTVRECTCHPNQMLAYQKRLSGPFMDRIDLRVTVSRVPHSTLLQNNSSSRKQHFSYVEKIKNAQTAQYNRYKSSVKNNGNITSKEIKKYIHLSPDVQNILHTAAERLNVSTRSYFKIIKVARTIADMDNSSHITVGHITEALQYRG